MEAAGAMGFAAIRDKDAIPLRIGAHKNDPADAVTGIARSLVSFAEPFKGEQLTCCSVPRTT